MNSWKSVESAACLPPLRMLNMGTGSSRADRPAQVSIEGKLQGEGGGAGDGQGGAEDSVGPQPRLVLRAVQVDEGLVHGRLVQGREAEHGRRDLAVDVLDGAEDALAAVAGGVAVAQLQGFVAAGAGARGHRCPAAAAVDERDLYLQGGVAAGVQDLPAANALDLHDCFLLGLRLPLRGRRR